MFEKLNDNLNDCAMVTAEEVPVLQIEQDAVPSEVPTTNASNATNTNVVTTTLSLQSQLQHFCETKQLSVQEIKCASNLLSIIEKIHECPELDNIENIEELENNIEFMRIDILRKLGKCYGLHNTHSLTKPQIIEKIRAQR